MSVLSFLLLITHQDLRYREIPDSLTAALAAIALITNPSLPNLAAALLLTTTLWLAGGLIFQRTGREALGIGDAKLLGVGVLVVGHAQLPELILYASIGGIIAALIVGKHRRQNGLPFAPFICASILICHLSDPLFLTL